MMTTHTLGRSVFNKTPSQMKKFTHWPDADAVRHIIVKANMVVYEI